MESISNNSIIFYGLSTCVHCKRVKDFLDANGIPHELHWVDLAAGDERKELVKIVKEYNPRLSFPTVVFNKKIIVIGDDIKAIKEALKDVPFTKNAEKKPTEPVNSKVKILIEQLEPLQKKRGYLFNYDSGLVEDLIEQLLFCKEKFGYMCCPCRLASGVKEKDNDIFCPCQYRDSDVAEYGQCFCGLYKGQDTTKCPKKGQAVPERRPTERSQQAWK